MDSILSSARFQLQRSWCDFSLLTGLDHRCVHCVVAVQIANTKQPNRRKHLKSWRPTKDSNNRPSSYHTCLNQGVSNIANLDRESLLEALLIYAGSLHAAPEVPEFHFSPSSRLKDGDANAGQPEIRNVARTQLANSYGPSIGM